MSTLVNIGVILRGYTAAFFLANAAVIQRVKFGATFFSQSCLNECIGYLQAVKWFRHETCAQGGYNHVCYENDRR